MNAYYSDEDGCWYVPVSCELWQQAEAEQLVAVEPARCELRDGQLWITQLAIPDELKRDTSYLLKITGLTTDAAERISADWNVARPDGAKLLILDASMQFEQLTDEQLHELGLQRIEGVSE